MSSRMPALFIGHGTPMNAIENNQFTRDWLQLAEGIPIPDAILIISAHWVTDGLQVGAMDAPRTIHDFGGFPPELFSQQYPAPGAPDLARLLVSQYDAQEDHTWGLDHGAWVPLKILYPEARIPVLQLSLDARRSIQQHGQLAHSLATLRDYPILIIGSGNIVHNIPKWIRNPYPADWAVEFNHDAVTAAQRGDIQQLCELPQTHRYGHDAVPTLEHYLPFLYIAAMQRAGDPIVFSQFEQSTLETACMHSMRIG